MTDEYNPDDYPLPEWVARRSAGEYIEVGAQLCTRDGRRMGNARVLAVGTYHFPGAETTTPTATIRTDMGTVVKNLTVGELRELFYPPIYVMHIHEIDT